MYELFSKLITHKQSPEEHILELRLSNTSDEMDAVLELDRILYDPSTDEKMLHSINDVEYEHQLEPDPTDDLAQEKHIYFVSGLKYCLFKDDNSSELPSYPQSKGKRLLWTLYFQSSRRQVPCTIEYYVFYRDQSGDVYRLHTGENTLDITIPQSPSNGVCVRLYVTRKENDMMDCGRYYFGLALRKPDRVYLTKKPYIQYVNIVPSRKKVTKVSSDMVGLEEVYSQMAALTQQKLFNDQRQAMNLLPMPINLHAAVMGGKGTGKTSFARVLYNYYVDNGFITDGKLEIVDASRWNKGMGDDTSSLENAISSAGSGMLYIENAASMIAPADIRGGNKEAYVEALVHQLREGTDEVSVVIADSPERISQLLATADLKSYIGQIYKLPTLTIDQMMTIAERECKERGFELTQEAKSAMKSYLSSQPNANSSDLSGLIDEMVMNMSVRVVNDTSELFPSKATLSALTAEDVPLPKINGYSRSMTKLNDLVGLKKLKYSIESHLNLVRFAQLRRQNGLKAVMPPLHMIFTGNPGTGKTTVANLLGEIYASLGILKTGQVIQVDRKKLVGQFIGDTEENTKRVLQQAHGNILFIDEAYTLVADPDDKKDFGPKVLDCLLEELSKESTDMIIIMAGYPDEMEKMLHSNKGLQSRFPYTFHFEDYTEDELMEIAMRTAQSSGYIFSDEATEKLRKLVHRECERAARKDEKRFGNARFVTRLISTNIIPNMSRRILGASARDTSSQALSLIEAADIPTSVDFTDYSIDEALLNRTLKQLDELAGLTEVKQTIRSMVSLARTKEKQGDDLMEIIPLQWTFTGSTGTGKSSVARLLAQILHAFHLISSDRMTQLRMPQTQNGGWTAYDIDRILRDTMKQAGLGLLFIDLDDVANSNIDVRWLRCKLTSLTAEMPGSYAFVIAVDDHRIPAQPIDMPLSTSVLHFADYTVDELMAILNDRLSKHAYTLSAEAAKEVYNHIALLSQNRASGLANARTMKHLYTALTSAAELRVNTAAYSDGPILITQEDVAALKWKEIQSTKIGF